MNKKRVIRFFLQFCVIVIVGAGIFWGLGYYRVMTSPEYKQLQELKARQGRYMADTYGGNTPEETLQLFIDALKKGDIELASKYFVLDKQEEWRKKIEKLQKEELSSMIIDLERASRGSDLTDNSARFIVTNNKNEVITVINTVLSVNSKWKITDM